MLNHESLQKDSAMKVPRMENKSLNEAFDFEQTLRKIVQRWVFHASFDSQVLNHCWSQIRSTKTWRHAPGPTRSGAQSNSSHNDAIGPVLNPFNIIEFVRKPVILQSTTLWIVLMEWKCLKKCCMSYVCTLMFTVPYSMFNPQSFLVIRNHDSWSPRNVSWIVHHGSWRR